MDTFGFPDLIDPSSFYDHYQLHQEIHDNTLHAPILESMPDNINKSPANATSRARDLSFPPVDSILYSTVDDWTQMPCLDSDMNNLQNIVNESPLMSTLERTSTTTSDSVVTPKDDALTLNSVVDNEIDNFDVSGNLESSKRSRPQDDFDSRSACWNSPLCPANGKAGPHPNPSTCDGGCATNLFDQRAMDQWFQNLDKLGQDENSDLLETEFTGDILDPVDMSQTAPNSEILKVDKNTTKREEDNNQAKSLKPRQRKHLSKRASSEESSSSPPSVIPVVKHSRRQPHNEIEKKYRESINTHLEALKNSIPAFQQPNNQCMQGKGDIEDLAAAPKPSKSIILASAVAHIRKIEKERRQLEQERNLLRQQVKTLQALVKCEDCSLMHYALNLNLGKNPATTCHGVS